MIKGLPVQRRLENGVGGYSYENIPYNESEIPYPDVTDFIGEPIEIGDRIAYGRSYGSSSIRLARATVLDIEWEWLTGQFKGKPFTQQRWGRASIGEDPNTLYVHRFPRLKIIADDNDKISRLTEFRGIIVVGKAGHDFIAHPTYRYLKGGLPSSWRDGGEYTRGYHSRCTCGWRGDFSIKEETAHEEWTFHLEGANNASN